MIDFRDFAPEPAESQATFLGLKLSNAVQVEGSLRDVLAAANEWVRANRIDVVNVETVVLPNMWHPKEEGSEDVEIRETHQDLHVTTWYQFIRVWFRTRR